VRAVALDVHREFCEVAVVAEGRLRSAGRLQARPEALELFAQSLDPRDLVALEVTGNAWAIARILEPHVARMIVVSPSDTGIRQARAKTDRLDARALARLLWAGQLDGVWTPGGRRAPWRLTQRRPFRQPRIRPGVRFGAAQLDFRLRQGLAAHVAPHHARVAARHAREHFGATVLLHQLAHVVFVAARPAGRVDRQARERIVGKGSKKSAGMTALTTTTARQRASARRSPRRGTNRAGPTWLLPFLTVRPVRPFRAATHASPATATPSQRSGGERQDACGHARTRHRAGHARVRRRRRRHAGGAVVRRRRETVATARA